MRKLLTSIALVAISVLAFGKASNKQLQLIKTDGISAIFDASKTASIEFVYAEDCVASYQGVTKMPYAQYVSVNGEWEEEHTYGENGFVEDWNKRNKKGMQLVAAGTQADYRFVITIHEIKEMATLNMWWEIVKGEIQMIDSTGKVVVEFNITEYYESMSELISFKAVKLRERIKETMKGLSQSAFLLAKKANK